jgi:hypothetical protein
VASLTFSRPASPLRRRGAKSLVSSLVEQLVSPSGDLRFKDAGEAELKGLRSRQQLFRVAWGPAADPRSEAAETSEVERTAKPLVVKEGDCT